MGLVEGMIGETEGCRVWLEEKGVADRRWEMVDIARGESKEVWSEEEESLFVFRGDKSEAVGVNRMEVFEIK
jgi:hypothetical protein